MWNVPATAPAGTDAADRADVEVGATLEATFVVAKESFEIAGVGFPPLERLPCSFYGVDDAFSVTHAS